MILQSFSLNRPLLLSNARKKIIQVEKLLALSMISRYLSSSFSLSFRDYPTFSQLGLNQSESRCNGLFVANMIGNGKEKQSTDEIGGKPWRTRRFSMRLRPRLCLLSAKLRRMSLRDLIEDAIFALTLSMVISLAMGFCFLLLKFTAVPMSAFVLYCIIKYLHLSALSRLQEENRHLKLATALSLTSRLAMISI